MRRMIPRPTAKQRGSALLLAVLVAAIVTLLAVQFAQAFVNRIHLSEYSQAQIRFETYLQGAETLLRQVLADDLRQDQVRYGMALDHLQEAWAGDLPPLPTDDGWLQVSVTDAQGLLNINNLATKRATFVDVGRAPAERFTAAQLAFLRLLMSDQQLALPQSQAVAILEAIVDWLDEDDVASGSGGAESLYYINTLPRRQPANQLMTDISELLSVRHVTPEIFAAIRPWLVALPEDSTLNINTAPPQILGLLAPAADLTAINSSALQGVLQARERASFIDLNEALAAGLPATEQGSWLGVSSNYFLADIRVGIGAVERVSHVLLRRDGSLDDNRVATIARWLGHTRAPMVAEPMVSGPMVSRELLR